MTNVTSRFLIGFTLLLPFALAYAAEVGPKVGQTAPEFSATDLSGKSTSLKQLREKGHVLLVFWSTRCHVCHAMIPKFKEINQKYGKMGVTLVAVNVGLEDKDEVDDYVFEHKLDYLVLNEDDKKADLAERYQLVGTPTMELVDSEGVVLYRGHQIPDLDNLVKATAKTS